MAARAPLVSPGPRQFLGWAAVWAGATALLVVLAQSQPALALGTAAGIGFTAVLLTGQRVGWWG